MKYCRLANFLTFLLALMLTGDTCGVSIGTSTSLLDLPESPRLAALARELNDGTNVALTRFWEEVKGKTPLVESISENDRLRLVTFLLRGGDEMRGMVLIGPVPPDVRHQPLTRFANTDLWFISVRLPAGARFSYAFARAGKKYLDTLNPLTFESDSLAELPGAPLQPWIQNQLSVPKGSVKQYQLSGNILKEERTVSIYTPAGYEQKGEPYGLLILFDGDEYQGVVPTPTILDNLAAGKMIRPLVAILVDNGHERMRDLTCSAPFAEFLAKELVPWARQRYHLSADPKRTIIGGSSLGGLAAAHSAFRYPEIFGNVLSQSGSFFYYLGWKRDETVSSPFGWLARQFETTPKLPIRFYLEIGLFETDPPINPLAQNRRLRDVLSMKGYTVTNSEYAGGHEYLCWRGSLADGLMALAPQH